MKNVSDQIAPVLVRLIQVEILRIEQDKYASALERARQYRYATVDEYLDSLRSAAKGLTAC